MNFSAVKNTLPEFTAYERTVLTWGMTVTAAYLVTHFYPEQAATAWTAAIAVNIVNYLYTSELSTGVDLNLFWTVSVLSAFFLTKVLPPFIALPVVGVLAFYYTSLKTEGASSRIYNTASLLNLATLLIYFIGSGQIEIYLLLSFVQGGPMLIDFFAS